MGKDREGKFHPPKGKPSGAYKSEGLGLQPPNPDQMNEYKNITKKYTEDVDEISDNVHLRHANRNTTKNERNTPVKTKNPERNKTHKERSVTDEFPKVTPKELPEAITASLFRDLASFRSEVCVSVYIPTHKKGMAVNESQDNIAFKTALNEADRLLKRRGTEKIQIEQILAPAYELVHDEMFWKNQKKGLAFFLSENSCQYLKLNTTPERKVVAEPTLYVIPLLETLLNEKHFYLLALSKGECRLFKGNKFGLEFMQVNDLPEGIRSEISDTGVSTTFRSTGEGASHGAGDGSDNDKVYLNKYLNMVDNAVWKQVLHNQHAPLLLAGVEYITAMFRDVSKYKNILEPTLNGNHERKNADELFEMAKDIVSPHLSNDPTEALKRYGDLSATEKTSDEIAKVISASYYGKIDSLFVHKGAEYWGAFDSMANKLTPLKKEDEKSEDLIDTAVVNTLANGGEVFLLEDRMPNGKEAAAIFRY